MPEAANSAAVRKGNRKRVFRYIYDAQSPVTKQSIAQTLSLSLPTVSASLSELMEEGLLTYSGTFASTGGRKPRAITVAADARFSVGIQIKEDQAIISAIDLRAQELASHTVLRTFADSDEYYAHLAQSLETFLDQHALPREKLLGVGIALPGIVQWEEELAVYVPTLGLRNRKLVHLRSHFPYPIVVVNDANASGFAESWGRPGQEAMVFLVLEKGVGGAILMGGQSYTGDHNRSGELGHLCVVPNGRRCRCGRQGCFEAYCSTARLSDDLGVTLEDFFHRLRRQDETACRVWDEYLFHLAQGIVNIQVMMDCDVVIGGVLTDYLEPYLPQLREEVSRLSSFGADNRILLSRYHTHSVCAGAALHFIDLFLQDV